VSQIIASCPAQGAGDHVIAVEAFAAWLRQDPERLVDPRAWARCLATHGHVRPVSAAGMRGEP
jgi:hypothetical protein